MLPIPMARAIYDYLPPLEYEGELIAGQYVQVPFGGRLLYGVVWNKPYNYDEQVPIHKLKPIAAVLNQSLELPPLDSAQLEFITWMAEYTMAPIGMILKMTIGVKDIFKLIDPKKRAKEGRIFAEPNLDQIGPTLSNDQAEIAAHLVANLQKGSFSVSLLDGVTGSGKTEVYYEAVAKAVANNRQVLILLPEIALSSQFVGRFEARFGVKPALWHSDITPAMRRKSWGEVAKGHAKVVIGARSALFLPFKDLGLVIVDEEHDASYKQSDGICYQARDMAIVRAKYGKAQVILASATPSLESLVNVEEGRYQHYCLPARFGVAEMPSIDLIDLRLEKLSASQFISLPLQLAIQKRLELGEQSLLFLNRRGYAPLLLCRHCGHRFACPHCTAWLVEHRNERIGDNGSYLECHHCGFRCLMPKSCPDCGSQEDLAPCGPGVERLAEEVKLLFPQARIAIASAETLDGLNAGQAFVQNVNQGNIDILIGTQIIAKGYHFPMLTLVGVIDADLGLQGGDLRASERCFQLLNQVAGRAGRESRKGEVLLQTCMPDSLVMRALALGSREDFLEAERANRQQFQWPPFARLAMIQLGAKQEDILSSYAEKLASCAPFGDDRMILGPAIPHLAKLKDNHRRLLLLKTDRGLKLQPILRDWLIKCPPPSQVQIRIDIDPYNFS